MLFGGLAASTTGAYVALVHLLLADVDASLAEWANSVGKVLATEIAAGQMDHVQDEISEYASTLPNHVVFRLQFRDSPDFIERATAPHPPLPAFPGGLVPGGDVYSTHGSGASELRLLARRIDVAGATYQLQIGASLATVHELSRRFQLILLWTLPLVLSVASLGGYWISNRALAPVDAITTAARALSLHNLSKRLDIPGPKDELQRLSRTWNEMLDRLEGAVARLSQFTADASHELRSPITLIRATAEIALSGIRTQDQYRAALNKIMSATLRISRLVEELLELARADAGQPSLAFTTVDLRSLVEAVHARMLPLAEARKQALTVQIPETACVLGNDAALRRLILILTDNAIKFTPQGGHIEVAVENGIAGTILRVRDDGIGISAQDLPHVFERFFRADLSRNSEEGAGLGLSIAQAIARAHFATIAAASEPGEGSVFSVEFRGTAAS
jgi:heavy metal sensor kinase